MEEYIPKTEENIAQQANSASDEVEISAEELKKQMEYARADLDAYFERRNTMALATSNFKKFAKEHKRAKVAYILASYLKDRFHVKTIGEDVREIFIYKDGTYTQGKRYLRKDIQIILEEIGASSLVEETIKTLMNLTVSERDFFEVELRYINLANGIYDIYKQTLLPHSHTFGFIHKLPVSYDRTEPPGKLVDLIKEIVAPEYLGVVKEWFGYCLYRKYFIKKAMIFVGPKHAGKTTVLNALLALIGIDNAASVDLQRLSSDKFAAANFYQKLINYVDDLKANDVSSTGAFKMATGGGYISGEYKYGAQFIFRNFAKLIFACNQIPSVKEQNDEAYFDRWIIIRFEKEFTGKERRHDIDDLMADPKELSGLLNWAIEGLEFILTEKDFSYNLSYDEIRLQMMSSGSSTAVFVTDAVKEAQDTDVSISKSEMFDVYLKFCHKHNYVPEAENVFGKNFKRYAIFAIDATRDHPTTKKRERCWKNIRVQGYESTPTPDDRDAPPDHTQTRIEDVQW